MQGGMMYDAPRSGTRTAGRLGGQQQQWGSQWSRGGGGGIASRRTGGGMFGGGEASTSEEEMMQGGGGMQRRGMRFGGGGMSSRLGGGGGMSSRGAGGGQQQWGQQQRFQRFGGGQEFGGQQQQRIGGGGLFGGQQRRFGGGGGMQQPRMTGRRMMGGGGGVQQQQQRQPMMPQRRMGRVGGGGAGGSAFEKQVCTDKERQEVLEDLLYDHERSQFHVNLINQLFQHRREHRNVPQLISLLATRQLSQQDQEEVYAMLLEDWVADFVADSVIRNILSDLKYNRKRMDVQENIAAGQEHFADQEVERMNEQIDNKFSSLVQELVQSGPQAGYNILNTYAPLLDQVGLSEHPQPLKQLENLIRDDLVYNNPSLDPQMKSQIGYNKVSAGQPGLSEILSM